MMPFGLKNAGATYQWLVNMIFRSQIGRNVEVYVDDMLVKSVRATKHIEDLRETFQTLRKYKMKLNPMKCAFRVSSGKFLGFMVDGDQGTASKDLVQVPIGPVTRARAKKFKDVLNGLIQELWAQANSGRPIEHDPCGQQRIVTLIQVLEVI
jgi:hypothetical protein